jgi:hypothetical protein
VLSVVLAVPALGACVILVSLEAVRAIAPQSAAFRVHVPTSLSDAITHGLPVEDVYAFIRDGQDPNEPVAVDDPEYTGGQALTASPLMLAIAAGEANTVVMLFNFGARLDAPANRYALCLAREIGNSEIMETLAGQAERDAAAVECGGATREAATPLRAWVSARQ